MRVPKYNSPVVQKSDLPGVRATTDAPAAAFGVGQSEQLSSAVSGAGEVVTKFAAKAMQDANEQQFKEAANTFDAYQNDLTAGKDGYMNIKGKSALGMSSDFQDRLKKKADEIAEGLSNDSVKTMFNQYHTKSAIDFKKQTDIYSNHEYNHFLNDSDKNIEETQRTRAVLNYNDPKLVEASIARQHDAVFTFAERNGVDPAPLIAKSTSKTREGIVKQILLGGNAMAADAYFQTHKDDFTADDALSTRSMLDSAVRSERADSLADKVIVREGITSPYAAYDRLKSIKDEKLREEAMSKIKVKLAYRESEVKDNYSKTITDVDQHIEKGGSLDDLPQGIVGTLYADDKKAFRLREEQIAGAREIKPDVNTYHKYATMNAYDLSKMRLGELITAARPYTTNDQWDALRNRWEASQWTKDGDSSKKAAWSGEESANEAILRDMQRYKIGGVKEDSNLQKLSDSDKIIYQNFKQKYDDASIAWSKQNGGKKPDYDTMKAITNKVVKDGAMQVYKEGFFSPSRVSVASLSESEKQKVFIPINEIPEPEVRQMINILSANNKLQGLTPDEALSAMKNSNSRTGNALKERIQRAYGQGVIGNKALIRQKLLGN